MVNIYRHAQEYMDEANAPGLDAKLADRIRVLLWKMYYAGCYARYKAENHLFDFEDLLLYTYDIYCTDPSCKRYPWIQVDEVQDLKRYAACYHRPSNGKGQSDGDVLRRRAAGYLLFYGGESGDVNPLEDAL